MDDMVGLIRVKALINFMPQEPYYSRDFINPNNKFLDKLWLAPRFYN